MTKSPTFILTALITTFLILTLPGCTKKEQASASQSLTVKEGVLKVGMDLQYPPFETFDDSMKPAGISVDIAQDFADSLGLELEIVNMDFSTLIPALETNAIDIAIASMSITEEREKKVDFSTPYLYFKIIGLMNSEYAKENKLDSNSTAEELWAVPSTKFIGLAGQISTSIPEKNGFDVAQSVDKGSAIMEVSQGQSDVLIISPEIVFPANKAFSDTTTVIRAALDVSPIGMAVSEGNALLLKESNDFIAGMNQSGGTYDRLREKYNTAIEEMFGKGTSMDFYIYEK